MKQNVLPVSGSITVHIEHVGGDLQVVGWERAEVVAKSDDNELSLTSAGQSVSANSPGDLILYVPREADLLISKVAGDADLRALAGKTELETIGGDLQMRNLGPVTIQTIGGDMSLRGCSGSLSVQTVGGDASLHDIKGNVKIKVGADLYLRNAEGNVEAWVGSDAALYLHPQPGGDVSVQAGSDILLRLPAKTDVELSLQGCDDESIRVDLPDVQPVEMGMFRKLVVGAGGSKIKLQAGAEVIVTSRDQEWGNVAEFDPLGREGPFAPGEFPGLSSDLHERISRRVEQATRRALEASMRTREQTDRVQRRVDQAMRRAEEKMRSAEHRSMHMGVKVGPFGSSVGSPRAAGPAVPPAQASEPVTDAERLAILKMLQEKKISLQEAEKLLAALDGK